jgi:RHS repeat-associated protein
MTLPRGVQHSYYNYVRGVAKSETQPEGISISRMVDNMGNITSITKGGFTTSYRYDGLGHLLSITYPRGDSASISYNYEFSKTYSRGRLSETVKYDDFKRPVLVITNGINRSYRYDALGRIIFASYPNQTIGDKFQYDSLGRITIVTHADSTQIKINYGSASVQIIDERGQATTYQYRAYGSPNNQFLIGIIAPLSTANVSIERNSKDKITAITQSGITHSYSYDSRYYITSISDPVHSTIYYNHDDAGNIIEKSLGSNKAIYNYDARNRLTSISYNDNGYTSNTSFTYDALDQVTQQVNGGVSQNYSYDANGNLTNEALNVDGYSFKLGYSYDNNDYLSSITYPDDVNQSLDLSPDAFGRSTKIGSLVSASYHDNDIVKELRYANGLLSTTDLNNRLWPYAERLTKNTSTFSSFQYTYDGTANVLNISNAIDSKYNRVLGYDALNRLISASGAWGAGAISYDGKGNILAQSFGSNNLTYSYNSSNQLTSTSGSNTYNFTYDVWGNVISNGKNTFTYDQAHNLRCIDCGKNSVTKFEYDASHYRVKKRMFAYNTYYFYSQAGQLILEYIPGVWARQYYYLAGKQVASKVIYGSDLDLDHDGISDRKEINQFLTSNIVISSYYNYLHTDLVGSPIGSSDTSGVMTWNEHYKPYGERQVKSGVAGDNDNWFAGKSSDLQTGLSYFGARYYDPVVGRFMSADSVEPDPNNVLSINRYAYANNNPYKFVDPDGRIPVDTLWDGASVIYDAGKIAVGYMSGNQVWITDGMVDLAADSAALFIPYAPAGSTKIARMAESVVTKTISRVEHIIPADRANHIFRNAEGHIADTPANRQLLQRVADDLTTTLGQDKYGSTWSAFIQSDGKQVWTQARGGNIINGGINDIPRTFNPESGLSALIKPSKK